MSQETLFQVGTYHLNDEPNFNFQLNRTITWSGGDIEDLKPISFRIKNAADWEVEFMRLGEKALSEGRVVPAIAYWRMAEFFMFEGNPRKLDTYRKARALFYQHYAALFENGPISRRRVPYEDRQLPVWVARPEKEPAKDVILLHGGNDSYLEEFLPLVLYLRQQGFAVYVFEGPGQGEVLREQGLPLTPEWEKPVGKILDAFHLVNVTIIGVSLGGTLAPRAAAFEKRIKRVVAWSILPNFLDALLATRKKFLQQLIRGLLSVKARALVSYLLKQQMRRDPLAAWGIRHGLYNMGVRSAYEYLVKAQRFQITDIARHIDQDFLLLGASRDHFLPVEFYKAEIDSLTQVRSLTYRLFTEKEKAENHCNVGNSQLVLDTIIQWIELMRCRDAAIASR